MPRCGAAAGLAAFLQPWTLVAAGAATVSQAKLSNVWEWLVLVLFCLLATSSFLYLELSAAFRPEAANALHPEAADLAGHPSGPGDHPDFTAAGVLAGLEEPVPARHMTRDRALEEDMR